MFQLIRCNSLILLLIVLIWIIQMTKAIPKFRFHKIFSLKYSIYLEKYNSILVNVRSFFDWTLGEGNFFFWTNSRENYFGRSVGIIIIIINLFFGLTHLKIKTLIMDLKKLVLLCQHKLHMKSTTSLYSKAQQFQMHYIFAFYVFYRNLKEIFM